MDKQIEKQMMHARQHLEVGEVPVAIVFGIYKARVLGSDSIRNGIFIATDRRLVFFAKKMFGFDLESFPYSSISSIEVSKGLAGHAISFFASGNKVRMDWINRGDVDQFTNHVRESIGKKVAASPPPLPAAADPLDQIRKLAELREAGLLSDDEFTAKKQDLLSRL